MRRLIIYNDNHWFAPNSIEETIALLIKDNLMKVKITSALN